MNTLLGELATLNDIQYPRYRIAFKLRKLQKALLLDQLDVGILQEALHLSGVGGMARKDVVPVCQLLSATTEIYSCLKLQRPIVGAVQIQQAQEQCANWLQMNYMCSTGGVVEAGSLKITLCLLTGSKSPEKARYLFSILANTNGAVECKDLAYFCAVTKQLAGTLQEQLYGEWRGPKHLWRDSLLHVRSAEDIEEEEREGGIRRPWLSQFEFIKLFSSSPLPTYLGWMVLYHRMPSMEKVIHPVRCAICTRKPVVSFRYQCTQCNNFNLCQMCFLKNRLTDKHTEAHQMMEFSSASQGHRSWRSRLLGSGRAQGGRLWTEPKSPFVYSGPRSSVVSVGKRSDLSDSPMHAIEDMLSSSQKFEHSGNHEEHANHHPTMIRIGSPKTSKKLAPHANHKRVSTTTNSSGSPDSASSGGKFQYEIPPSSGGPSTISSTSDLRLSPTHSGTRVVAEKARSHSAMERPVHPQEDLAAVNKRLSLELDELLNDLPPPAPTSYHTLPAKFAKAHKVPINLLEAEEKALKGQVSTLTNKREKLAGELEGLISQVQDMSINLSHGIRTNSLSPPSSLVAPAHSRSDSLPAEAYLNSPSPPSVSPLLQHKHSYRGSQPLLSDRATSDHHDPLAEYPPTDLDSAQHVDAEHRSSMAW